MTVRVVTLVLLIVLGAAEFTTHFDEFIRNKYGEDVQQKLERQDLGLGPLGSFGGKASDSDPVFRRPIIFVHGVTTRAVVFLRHREFLIEKGYSSSELYATSYGDGGWTPFMENPITCDFIEQIRRMIVVVHHYTQKKVDIIAWSMGSPITRKAILGGRCTENGRYLGRSITDIVDTFITLGGVNYGIESCPSKKPACNPVNSMHYNCTLLRELNSQPARYEAVNSYSLYSLTDQIIGRYCGGKICAELANANASFEKANYDHLSIMTETLNFQFELMNH